MIRRLLLLLLLAAAFFWLLGRRGRRAPPASPSGTPARGEPLVRDPVCGVYLPRSRALAAGAGAGGPFFCSGACRDRYLAGPGRGSG